MNSDVKLMQKSGVVTISIAKELLALNEGGRIETVKEYSEKFQVANWSANYNMTVIKK